MHVALYLLLSYAGVAIAALAWVLPRTRRRGASGWVTALILMALLMLPLFPYALVEGQTLLCRAALMPATRQALRELYSKDQILWFKVLSINPRKASSLSR